MVCNELFEREEVLEYHFTENAILHHSFFSSAEYGQVVTLDLFA
jgi:hypothetical protein